MSTQQISPAAAAAREQARDPRGRFGPTSAPESDVVDLGPATGGGLRGVADRLTRDVDLDPEAVTVTDDDRIVITPPGGTPGSTHVQIEVTQDEHEDGTVGWTATTVAVGPPDRDGMRDDDENELVRTSDPAELATEVEREIVALDDDGYGGGGNFPVYARREEPATTPAPPTWRVPEPAGGYDDPPF